jgi:Flp pilus assembly pilin Flp
VGRSGSFDSSRLAALIVAGLIGVITTLGGNVLTAFTSLSTATSGS